MSNPKRQSAPPASGLPPDEGPNSVGAPLPGSPHDLRSRAVTGCPRHLLRDLENRPPGSTVEVNETAGVRR
jgi:hypothetical protein